MEWWKKNKIRMIQNNIRDIDAKMDLDRQIQWLKDFGANTLQIGCGGITAFYPSKLDCQWINPYMEGDFFGEVLKRCHENDIRVIARFDFSKTHECFYEAHPDWYFKGMDGKPVRYHDTVATCVNGAYQRKKSLDIIREVLEKYPVDGIFFNMFGYITWDYSGNYVGICQCENCKKRFWEMYGEPLPVKEELENPVFEKYLEFKKQTVDEMLFQIRALTKRIRRDCAVSTYEVSGVDIVRNESNSAVDRPLPFWIYSSSDQVGEVEGSYEDKICSNCCINAVDLPYRFMGVSDSLNQIRLWGNLAAGGGLDWCIIGNFDEYPDYENFASVRSIFRHHQTYEAYYGNLSSKTKIMLVKERGRKNWSEEYRGIFRMLREEHILFTVTALDALESKIPEFDAYEFIILPEILDLPESVMQALKNTKACIVATGLTLETKPEKAEALFGIKLSRKIEQVRGTYLRTEPDSIFKEFARRKKKWVFLDFPYRIMQLDGGTKGLLPKVEKARFGPPERCWGNEQTQTNMIAVSEKKNIYIPWYIGTLYELLGYEEFKRILMETMESVRPIPRSLETNAPEMLEIFFASCGEKQYLLQMINLTGFNGSTWFQSHALENIKIRFRDVNPIRIERMGESGMEQWEYDGEMRISMERGEIYQSYLVTVDG